MSKRFYAMFEVSYDADEREDAGAAFRALSEVLMEQDGVEHVDHTIIGSQELIKEDADEG